jgi:hypothetical protein
MRHNRGIPTKEVLTEMRENDPPICYLVGTPKGRLSKLEAQLLEQPWKDVRPGLEVKLLAQEKELYILAQSRQRLTTGETLSQIALSSTGPRGRFCSQTRKRSAIDRG